MVSKTEFIAMMAMLFATVAFSIDSLLPALPQIGMELIPDTPNKAQLVITAFVMGMGVGTFFSGPLSDSVGRKPIIMAGAILYICGAYGAYISQSFEMMIAARFVQGLGASGPRIVGMAILRDLFRGREMAKIMSIIMLVFTLVPAVAPLIGAGVIALAGWRAIFGAFVLFALVSGAWYYFRQEESLAVADRRPFRGASFLAAIGEMARNPLVVLAILAQSMCYVALLATISLVQPTFDITFGRAETFPLWFAAMALVSAASSVLNAMLVVRLGMRRLATTAFGAQVVLSSILAVLWLGGLRGDLMFYAYFIWQTSVFFQVGLTIGNLNAIAMDPMGHIAGMAASIIGSVSTLVGAAIVVPVGLAFDGTPMPLVLAVFGASLTAFVIMRRLARYDR